MRRWMRGSMRESPLLSQSDWAVSFGAVDLTRPLSLGIVWHREWGIDYLKCKSFSLGLNLT